jgi:hypothetical protein
MSSTGIKEGGDGIEKKSMVNYYLNSLMPPPKTLRFKEGVLHVEDVKAPKTEGSMEETLRELEGDTHRYRTIVEHSLDPHFQMIIALEKKVEAYEGGIKDLEEKYMHTLGQLDRFQALMWDVENQNCEYEDRFQKIAKAANPSMSFHIRKPYPWKLKKWEAYNKEEYAAEEGPSTTN